MALSIIGLHHLTAIATDPQRNLDFYVGLLGLRFLKRTVNFDDPGSYHFYFGDARGTPGTILTFFPWPGARRGIRGTGQIEATAFAIPPNSVSYWLGRLKEQNVAAEQEATGNSLARAVVVGIPARRDRENIAADYPARHSRALPRSGPNGPLHKA